MVGKTTAKQGHAQGNKMTKVTNKYFPEYIYFLNIIHRIWKEKLCLVSVVKCRFSTWIAYLYLCLSINNRQPHKTNVSSGNIFFSLVNRVIVPFVRIRGSRCKNSAPSLRGHRFKYAFYNFHLKRISNHLIATVLMYWWWTAKYLLCLVVISKNVL